MVPAPVHEEIEEDQGRYSVEAQGVRYEIYGPSIREADSWGNATFAIFDIVNRQLEHTDVKLFALNGGNDLFGIFMTPEDADLARRALPNKRDWPYIATPEPNWNGAYHD
jgi:hypothetical protein